MKINTNALKSAAAAIDMPEIIEEVSRWYGNSTSVIKSRAEEAPIRKASQWVGMVKNVPSWDRSGLEMLVDDARMGFVNHTGVELPYNLATHGPWVGMRRHGLHYEDRDIMVGTAARFAGWLDAARELHTLQRLLARTQSGNGMNSPRTTVHLYDLVKACPNPGRLNSLIGRVIRRANDFLAGFDRRVSWQSIGEAFIRMGCNRAIGKIAIVAAALTVSESLPYPLQRKVRFVREARDLLILSRGLSRFRNLEDEAVQYWVAERVAAGEFSCLAEALDHADRLVEDRTDDVEGFIDPNQSANVHRVQVTRLYTNYGRDYFLCKQEGTGRTFHAERYAKTAREATKEAIRAWRIQVMNDKAEKEQLRILMGEECTHFVFLEDSLDSGNCEPGTQAWLNRNGLKGRRFCCPQQLLPFKGNPAVRRVLVAAASRVSERLGETG